MVSDKPGVLDKYTYSEKDGKITLTKEGTAEIKSRDFCMAGAVVNKMLKALNDVDPATLISSSEFRSLKKSVTALSVEFAGYARTGNEVSEGLAERLDTMCKEAQRYLLLKDMEKTKNGELKPITQKPC